MHKYHRFRRRKRMNYSKAKETKKGPDGSTDWNPVDTTFLAREKMTRTDSIKESHYREQVSSTMKALRPLDRDSEAV